jgi:ABC-type uncharacterized transport system ATPase subunit
MSMAETNTHTAEKDALLEMRHITKRFPGVVANRDVNLTLYPNEVQALLGENGAGKSTLMNVLTGIYFPSEGTIRYKGEFVSLDNPQKAVALGIGMVHQHFLLVDTLTVAENIILYTHQCGFLLNSREVKSEIQRYADQFGLAVDPSAKISQLSIGEQQRVEILKLLISGSELLILDEPTSVLTPQESSNLFHALREMASGGKSVLVITHKMCEVMQFADRITVLRNGCSIATMPVKNASQDELTLLMVGKHLKPLSRCGEEKPQARTVLELKDVCALNARRLPALHHIDLMIHEGEIVGLAGVSGNGQNELAEVIAGLRKVRSGQILLNGADVTGQSPAKAYKNGIAYIPEDRLGVGLVGKLNLSENYILKSFRLPENSKHGLIHWKAVDRQTSQAVADYDVKCVGVHSAAGLMSGGNLQKLLVAREIHSDPKVIVASYPVHGLDINATNSIYSVLLAERAKGKAILLISEDLDDLFALSDRIAVLYAGSIVSIMPANQTTVEAVGKYMLGNRQEGGKADETQE